MGPGDRRCDVRRERRISGNDARRTGGPRRAGEHGGRVAGGLARLPLADWLWVTVAYFTLFIGFVYAPLLVLGPEVARTSLGGAGAWAAIATALGLGSLVGGLIGFRWRPRYPLRVAFLTFLIAGPALFGLLAADAPLPLIVAVALVDGASGPLFNTLWYTALQREVPASELSRVSSWDYLGSVAMLPAGQAISGPVGEAIGISTTLYLAGALFLVLLLAVLAVPAVRNFSSEPAVSAA